MMATIEKNSLSSEFSSLLSNTLTSRGHERLFNIAFVFTVETGFIPISLEEQFNSTDSNIKLAKTIKSQPLNSFWYKDNDNFHAKLVMSNQLCHLIGVSIDGSLIITLIHSSISKCINFEDDEIISSENIKSLFDLSLKYKNLVSVPVKCAIKEITVGQYPSLCGVPEELISYILTKLNPPDLYSLMLSCKKMYHLVINNQLIWKKIVIELVTTLPEAPRLLVNIPDWRLCYYDLNRTVKCKRKVVERIRE
ncbi:hypothetical protein AGLY_005050 [Aphis glycines]|uniref:F-box domain-containing protein n=1 Tax=Aphis glycines TaxID=307491 RepID=A0A6G0TVM5_APHGL|nr:hypothetical protein AGLY_005050 [Aphis glycines]